MSSNDEVVVRAKRLVLVYVDEVIAVEEAESLPEGWADMSHDDRWNWVSEYPYQIIHTSTEEVEGTHTVYEVEED